MGTLPITVWVQERIRQLMPHPLICLDATAGRGKDTLFLCEITPPEGLVYAMDIQESALEQARERIEKAGYGSKVRFIADGHEHMDRHVSGNIDLIMFNLGYLPGGDHRISTAFPTTGEAVLKGLSLLRPGGLMTLVIYSGGDSGYDERDALIPFLKEVDSHQFTVILESFHNRPGSVPLPVYILKHRDREDKHNENRGEGQ